MNSVSVMAKKFFPNGCFFIYKTFGMFSVVVGWLLSRCKYRHFWLIFQVFFLTFSTCGWKMLKASPLGSRGSVIDEVASLVEERPADNRNGRKCTLKECPNIIERRCIRKYSRPLRVDIACVYHPGVLRIPRLLSGDRSAVKRKFQPQVETFLNHYIYLHF